MGTMRFTACALALLGCSTEAAPGDDALDDAGPSDTVGDSANDAEPDAEPETTTDTWTCDGLEPRCEGESVVACVDGTLTTTPCEAGFFCNYGACEVSEVDLPADAGPHDFKSEWWYYTGHVNDGTTEYGFEVTIFNYRLAIFSGYMCHIAVLDATAGRHYHTDEISILPAAWQSDPVVLEVGACRFELDGAGHDRIRGTIARGRERDSMGAPWTVDLTFDPQKRPALHGGGGFIPMSDAGGTSWYYSYTRNDVVGTITDPDGVAHEVAGLGWMDHQWGDFDVMTEFKGWDWWSVQLDDNWEVMLFQFRDWDDVLVTQAGTVMDPDGNQYTFEGLDAFAIASRRTWDSPHTDGVYPLDWDISIVPGSWTLDVAVGVDDQEMYNPAQNYWEGATTITGTRDGAPIAGVGYTELTGYASDLLDPPHL
jgi:predicted secreted hydrolase